MIKKRSLKIYTAFILILSALILRLFTLTDSSSKAASLSRGQRYSVPLSVQRGNILDRNDVSLLDGDNDIFAVCLPPLKGGSYAAERLSECSSLSPEKINKLITANLPFAVKVNDANLRLENVALLEVSRRFPRDGVAAHLIGYTSDGGSKGVCGLEAAFDNILRCETSLFASLDVAPRTHELLSASLTQNGSGDMGGIKLTLDKRMSQFARWFFEGVEANECGAVVVMDANNGDLFVCESFPAYDPNNVANYLNSPNAPLMNRAFSSFNLGSAFKIVTAAAIIENHAEDFTHNCRGYVHVGMKDVACHNGNGHGNETLSSAFADSCNPYFIKAALSLGREPVFDAARRFGFGIAYRFADGLASAPGSLPEANSLAASAALANFSIGQGELMATPIQVALMVSAVANGGVRPVPRLVESVFDADGDTCEVFDTKNGERVISAETAKTLRELMVNAVENGTGKNAKPKIGGAGGKTATAQTGSFIDGKRKNNAWFAGFFPADNPKYTIVVLAENGTSGSVNAAPVFKKLCDYLSDLEQLSQTP